MVTIHFATTGISVFILLSLLTSADDIKSQTKHHTAGDTGRFSNHYKSELNVKILRWVALLYFAFMARDPGQ